MARPGVSSAVVQIGNNLDSGPIAPLDAELPDIGLRGALRVSGLIRRTSGRIVGAVRGTDDGVVLAEMRNARPQSHLSGEELSHLIVLSAEQPGSGLMIYRRD